MQELEVGTLLDLVRAVVREELRAAGELSLKPKAVSYKKAALLLDVGLTQIKSMAARGVILTQKYEDSAHPKIPMTEIDRLTAPTEKAKRDAPRPRRTLATGPRYSVEAELAKLKAARAARKKRR